MDLRKETKYGDIFISPRVIAKAAGMAACESFGVVGMAYVNFANGLTTLLSGDELTKGVKVEIEDNIVRPSILTQKENNVIEAVKYKVEELTGLPVSEINIFVEGVRVID